jgi:hypothetical protein
MILRKLLSPIRYWWQRRTRGFDDCDLWSLDYTVIKFVYPRLKLLRDQVKWSVPRHPTEVDSQGHLRSLEVEEWKAILDEMLEGFQLVVETDCYPLMEDDHKKLEHSMDVFREWFFSLWD